MTKCDSPLEHVSIAAPCNVGWDNMVGSDRVRFCGQCSLNVYNLSAMSKSEAERLVSQTEGRLCIRYYRRADGTILTKNCPIGLRALKRRVSRIASASISAALSFFAGLLAATGLREQSMIPAVMQQDAVIIVNEELPEKNVTMGMIAAPEYTTGKARMGEARVDEGWLNGDMIRAPSPEFRAKRK